MSNISLPEILNDRQNDLTDYYQVIRDCAGSKNIFWDSILHSWVVTGYKECSNLIDSKFLSKSRLALSLNSEDDQLISFVQSILDAQMMFCDGEEVQERRRYWSRQINAAELEEKNNDLDEIARITINDIHPNKKFNLYDDLLRKYVSRVICYRLKLTEDERLRLSPMITHYVRFLDGKLKTEMSLKYSLVSIVNMYSELGKKIDLFPDVNTTKHKWISDYILMVVAGHESTAYLLATLLVNVKQTGSWNDFLSSDSRLIGGFIKESLRYDSPIQIIGRKAVADFTLNGQKIKADDKVLLHVGAANRDPEVFDEPNIFLGDRVGSPPLSFGLDDSKCIGHSLALRECMAFINSLVSEGVILEIDSEEISWDNGIAGRNFNAIPAVIRR